MDWLAQGVEVLADEGRRDAAALRFDVVIVGSGYGGAVMAARLARLRRADGARLRIAVLERGREYVPGEFPNDLGMLPGAVRVDRADRSQPIGNPDALFHVHVDRDVCVLTGSALGGTSQINANVAIEAGDDVLRGPQWPRVFRETPGLLDAHYAQARRTLGVVDYPGDVPKARAFAAVAPHIERRHLRDADPKRPIAGARLKRAPLAVRFAAADDASAPENPAGVAQKACIECGDCVSGCNHWAKNTLTMNYLPLARRRGVRLFTGATVQHLRPDPEGGWIVTVDATVAETRPVRSARIDGGPMHLRAARVVLCAGALGSTEILLRSRAVHALSLSPRLGAGFSTNGDMISAAYWQRDPVGAVGLGAAAGADPDPDAHAHRDTHVPTGSAAARPRVGPTITSIVDLRDARVRERRILIEDGAVPGALGDVFGEVLATAALLPQRVRWKTQAQRHRDPDMDPEGFGVSDTATHHSQLLLSIGHDDARGVLALKSGRDDDGFRRVRIDWQGDGAGAPSAQAQPVYRHQADLLRGVEARGAIHLENPLWRPVPEALASALGAGALPQGVLVSVHPLGGCRMADDAADGVCNAQGEVFVGPHGTSVHAGLHVCDGSILPSSLGANPFLTIAALAERCAGLIVRQMMDSEGLVVCDEMDPLPAPPVLRPAPPIGDRRVAVVFEERMRGRPEQLDDAAALVPIFGERLAGLQRARAAARRAKRGRDDLPMPGGTQAGAGASVRDHGPVLVDAFDRERAPFLALDVRLEIADLRDYVRTLGRSRRPAPVAAPRVFGQLRILHDRSDLLAGQDVDPFGDCSIELSNGRFDLFVERRAWALRRLGSGVLEFARLWWRHRPGPGSPPPEAVRPEAVHPEGDARGVGHALRRAMAWIAVKVSLMRHLGTERTIDYRFDFVGRDGRAYRLVGRKRLAFADALNPWLSVADADFEIHARNAPPGVPVWSGRLRLDPLEIVQYRVPQVTHAPHAPESIVQMASYGLLFARAILGTHLLHFRAPDYLPARPFDDTPHGAQPQASPAAPEDASPPAPEDASPPAPEDASPDTSADALPDAPAHTSPAPPAGASARRRRWPGPLPGTHGPVHHRIAIDDDPLSPGLHIALTHYAPPASTVPRHTAPVMVFHGILHSTLAFATDTVDENLTQALCRAGYDVWLVDFRTSIAFGDDPQPLSFDQIARHDVPAAVRHVLERSGAGQVNVFAHCMGAAVFSMALLGRWVDPRTIRALVYCQVSFLVANAYGNRLRAEVSAFVRDALAFDRINPRADASADALERLLDRVATTMPVPPAERDAHRARTPVDPFGVHRVAMPSDAATCNRLTLLIGRHWFHHNLDPRTHAALGELLGPSRIETFFQIQHFGLRGRVMTALGDNAYVTDENLRHAFGALPVLFIQGAESDVFDTRTTRLAHRKLRAVTGLDHRIRLYPGYGHLECVFGRDASTVVYPDVVRFFAAPPSNVAQPAPSPAGPDPMAFPPRDGIPTLPDAEAASDAAGAAGAGAVPGAPAASAHGRPVVRAPWIGPVLGAARPDPDDPDRLLVRVWFAPDTRVTDAPWGWVEYRGALSRFASQQARFAATRWPAGTQGGPVMPRHV
ncbi:MAG TPA: alpha/beta fold hydrolase, partial [Quisquiliibacterium sp.]|nr:alpha/beta fold hydrolase [Quisquiliibacterium sp.]